jgi:hypothetical protein
MALGDVPVAVALVVRLAVGVDVVDGVVVVPLEIGEVDDGVEDPPSEVDWPEIPVPLVGSESDPSYVR